jgi:hypothetical protein
MGRRSPGAVARRRRSRPCLCPCRPCLCAWQPAGWGCPSAALPIRGGAPGG